jgi:hypothetical protein
MAIAKKRISFLDSGEGIQARQTLQSMTEDSMYNTGPSYSANTGLYPDNLVPFVAKHMNYLIAHPNLDAHQYVSNIRLMTRIKT